MFVTFIVIADSGAARESQDACNAGIAPGAVSLSAMNRIALTVSGAKNRGSSYSFQVLWTEGNACI